MQIAAAICTSLDFAYKSFGIAMLTAQTPR
jgi:hypothetical protein